MLRTRQRGRVKGVEVKKNGCLPGRDRLTKRGCQDRLAGEPTSEDRRYRHDTASFSRHHRRRFGESTPRCRASLSVLDQPSGKSALVDGTP